MSHSSAALLALALYGVTTRVIEPRPLRAFAAFVAAQSALLYGYSQWGGVKEMASAALLVLLAALTPPALQKDVRARNLLPLATATAALLGVLSLDGGVWVAPILLPALIVGIRLHRTAFIWLAGVLRRCSPRFSRCPRCFSHVASRPPRAV